VQRNLGGAYTAPPFSEASLPLTMPQPTTVFVPYPFAALADAMQEPKSATDKPAGTAPTGTAGTQTPAPAGQPPGPCGGNELLLYMGGFLALMYFLVMRPEQKRKKQQQAMLTAIKQGDRVVTLGGMHGIVMSLTEKTVTLRVDTVKMTFDRVAIARVERDDATTTEAPKT
jgi:preprotein translocase subunit YajC